MIQNHKEINMKRIGCMAHGSFHDKIYVFNFQLCSHFSLSNLFCIDPTSKEEARCDELYLTKLLQCQIKNHLQELS